MDKCMHVVFEGTMHWERFEIWKRIGQLWQNTAATTAQGKQEIWFLLFPDRKNTGNSAVT